MPNDYSVVSERFKAPSPPAIARVAHAKQALPRLLQKERYLKATGWIFLGVAGLGSLVEFALAYGFNDRIVGSNLHEALTPLQEFLRVAAALGMMLVVAGSGSLIHAAFNKTVTMPFRIVSGFFAALFAVGIYHLAGAIGNQVFGPLLDQLWQGASGAPQLSFDISTPSAPPSPGMPYWLTLVSASSLFLGVAVLVIVCELAWFFVRKELSTTRELIAKARAVLSANDRIEAARARALEAERDLGLYHQVEFRKNVVHHHVANAQQRWRHTIETKRPAEASYAAMTPDDYARRLQAGAKVEEAIEEVKQIEAGNDIRALIDRLFDRHAVTPTPSVIERTTP